MITHKLTTGAIQKIININYHEEKHIETDFNLQIATIKHVEQPNNKQFTFQMSLSDPEYQCKHFILQANRMDEFKQYDIIKLKKIIVNVKERAGKTNVVFFINSANITVLASPGKLLFENTISVGVDSNNQSQMQENKQKQHDGNHKSNVNMVQQKGEIIGNNKNEVKPKNVINNHNNNQSSNNRNQSSNVNRGFPLAAITTFSKDFTIVVRCSKKNSMKNYTNAKGPGNLFSFLVIDHENTEIEIIAFNQNATRIYDLIQEGKIYSIEGLYAKIAAKKFSACKSDFVLNCSDNVKVTELKDDSSIKTYSFDITKISEIKNLASDSLVDLFGKVIQLGDVVQLSTKNGTQDIRKVIIVDDSNTQIEISLWREHTNVTFMAGDFVVFKAVKVKEYNGTKSINFSDSSIIVVDPSIPEKTELKLFFETHNDNSKFDTLIGEKNYDVDKIVAMESVLKSFDNCVDDVKLPIFKIKGMIIYMVHGDRKFYLACKECKKKLADESNLVCQFCQKKNDSPNYVYMLTIKVRDHTGEYYVDVMSAVGDKLMGISCNEYRNLVLSNDTVRLDELLNHICYKPMMLVLAPKNNLFNNTIYKKISLLRFEYIDDNQKETNRLNDILSRVILKK